jgi:signal transduction histidine kinase/ActR/RegA family two-component response regulator
VRDEVASRLRVTTAMSASLLAEQLGSFITLAEAGAGRPRLRRAVADGRPSRFDDAEIRRELAALAAAREEVAGTGLVDLGGILRGAPASPELIGNDYRSRDWYKGLLAAGDTYVSEAFESAQATHPLVVTIATYVRGPGRGETPGAPLAILLLGVELDAVQASADSVAELQDVDLWVADRRGVLLAAPWGRMPGRGDVADEPIGRAASLPAGRLASVELAGEPTFVVRQPVQPLGWTVFAALPRAEADRGADAVRGTMLSIAIPLGLVVCCGIVLLVRLQRRHWRAEAALAAADDQARQASLLKTEFLSRISHELRTPLNAILGFGQLLELDDLNDEQRESVEQMLRGGRHLLGLISEVLDISRIETGNLALSIEAVDVLEIVTETADLIRPLAAEREIRVQPPSASDCLWTVQADRQRLRQVLLNLASNAVKYNRHGGSIRIACHPTAEGRIGIMVQDTGPGIPAERMERLLRPFDRLGAEHGDLQGTGLGLALSKGLMEAMGGSLTADSVEHEGTAFTIELPVATHPLQRLDTGPATPPTQRHGPGAHAEHTVLYVDDNPANLRLVKRVLARRGGVRLVAAPHGGIVQRLVRERRPDLVLLDLHLPDMPGQEVLRRLRSNPKLAEIPVVVLSADARPSLIEQLLQQGARSFLTKPLDVKQLLGLLDDVAAERGQADAPAPTSS